MLHLSIITVNYNDAKGLAKTRQSLTPFQNCEFNFEWIVIDGGSTDRSVEEARKPVAAATRVVVESEPDNGIYDAMNKGIKRSEGVYVIFMNSGDRFTEKAPQLLSYFFKTAFEKIDVKVFGILSMENNKPVKTRIFDNPEQLKKSPSVPHQSTLIKRNDLIERGYYRTDYKLLSDYDMFCQLYKNGKIFDYSCSEKLAIFEQGGASSIAKNQLIVSQEARKIQKHHFNKINLPYSLNLGIKYILLRFKWLKPVENIIRRTLFKK